MAGFASAVIAGVTAFAATNIDDIVILMLFFAQRNASFRTRHIVIGQYVGFLALILASLPGFFGGMILPKPWIGLLGLLPIVIGLKQLISREVDDEPQVQAVTSSQNVAKPSRSLQSLLSSLLSPQTYSVAAVTFANGGDNIGIYIPLFASSNATRLLIILGIFLVLVAVWCAAAYSLAQHPLVARILTRYGEKLVPFVLIGLGIFILIDNDSYELLPHLH